MLVALLPSALAAQAGPTAGVDSIFASQQGTDQPGCAVSVVDRGRLVLAKGYGMADLAQGLAIGPHSIFHVASVSKQFTAMSLVLMARAGKLSLDDDLRRYLPEIPDYGYRITIRQLLNHTSGIRDQWNLLITAGWRLGDDLITEQDVMDIVPRQRGLNFAPGTDWLYSNSGFTLAAVIVKRVTGQTLRQFADSALFRPLGMTSTHFHDDNLEIVPGRTRGYTYRNGSWKETVPNYSTVGATSLFTTVTDLARWQAQLTSGVVGGRGAIDDLTTRGVLTTGDTLGYALGVSVGHYRGARTVSHSGGDPGYQSHLLNFPATGSGVAVLCNTAGVTNPVRLAEQTADVMLADQLQPVAPLAAQATAAQIGDAGGLYWSDSLEASGRIAVDNGLAVWRGGPNAPGAPLRLAGAGRFLIGAGPATVTVRDGGMLVVRSGNGEPAWYRKTAEWSPTATDRTALAGRFASDELGVTWEIAAAGDSLVLNRRKNPPSKLTPLVRDTYLITGGLGAGVIRAVRDRKGKVTGITVGSGRVRRMLFPRAG